MEPSTQGFRGALYGSSSIENHGTISNYILEDICSDKD